MRRILTALRRLSTIQSKDYNSWKEFENGCAKIQALDIFRRMSGKLREVKQWGGINDEDLYRNPWLTTDE
jgi:hypothetical protein